MRKNNTTISFSDFIAIAEGKQVGTIYHFTKQQSLIDMIESDFNLKSNQEYISFTRNYNMIDYESYQNDLSFDWKYFGNNRGIRIAIDGDKLSNKFKIEPFMDIANNVTRDKGEAEERVKTKPIKIGCCIKQIDVIGTDKAYNHFKPIINDYCSKSNNNIKVQHVKKLKDLKKVK